MSISDPQFLAWLKRDSEKKTVLCKLRYMVEEAGEPVEKIFRCSDRGYIDTTNEEAYPDYIQSVPSYTRSLSGDRLGVYTSSVGTLELDNDDGVLDYLLGQYCDGSSIEFYLGDESWLIDDFRLMFSALIVKISATAWDKLSVLLKDTSLLLDKSIGGTVKIGGDGPNAEQFKSVNFGYVNSIECILQSEIDLRYCWDEDGVGYLPALLKIKDRGLDVTYTDNGDGTVDLDASPDGEITACTLVDKTGLGNHRCISDLVEWMVSDRCGLGDLGLYEGPGDTYDTRPDTGVQAFIDAGGQDYLIGINISDKRNVASDLLPQAMDSGLCSWCITRQGMFRLIRLRPNDVGSLGVSASFSIDEDDILNQISLVSADPTYYRYQAIMSKNWKISSDFALSLTPEELARLTRKGLYVTQPTYSGTTYADNPEYYDKTLQVSPEIETLLSGSEDDLDRENYTLWLDLRRDIFLPWIETISVAVDLTYYSLELGDVGLFQVPRYGFNAGKLVQVIYINFRLTDARIDLKLLHRRIPEAGAAPGPPDPPDESDGLIETLPPYCNLFSFLPCTITFSCFMRPFNIIDLNCEPPIDPHMTVVEGSDVPHFGSSELGMIISEDSDHALFDDGSGGGGGVYCGLSGEFIPRTCFSMASDIPNLTTFGNPYDIGNLAFSWAWDTWASLIIGTGMTLGTTSAYGVDWYATITGYQDIDPMNPDLADGTIVLVSTYSIGYDVMNSTGISVNAFATTGGFYGGGYDGNILHGWELYVANNRQFSPPAVVAPFFDVAQKTPRSFVLQASIGGTPVCSPLSYTQFDSYPPNGT